MATVNYDEFNKFQSAFYTNIDEFKNFSKFDVKKHGYTLLNNLAKGFPNLANLIINLKGLNWSGAESHQILIALQRNFINNFNSIRIPQFIYWKSSEKETIKKSKVTNKGLEFSPDIVSEIQSILFYDEKTFEYFKFSDKVQKLGKELLGQLVQSDTKKNKKIKL